MIYFVGLNATILGKSSVIWFMKHKSLMFAIEKVSDLRNPKRFFRLGDHMHTTLWFYASFTM